MSLGYGQRGYRISDVHVSSVNLVGSSLTSYVTKSDNFGEWTFSMNNVGCGSTGANILIDDSKIPFVWTHIAWRTRPEFRSSCFNFANGSSNYGVGTPNIEAWNPSLGDAIARPKNCFELSQYAVNMYACNNNADNFMHQSYATGSFREWRMKRRRVSSSNPAGAAAGFACTNGGTCIISDIVVWREE